MQKVYWLLTFCLACIMTLDAQSLDFLKSSLSSASNKRVCLRKACCGKKRRGPPGPIGEQGLQGPQGLPGTPGITVGNTFGYFTAITSADYPSGPIFLNVTSISTPNLILTTQGGVLVLEDGDYLLNYSLSGVTVFNGGGGSSTGLDMGISVDPSGFNVFPTSVYNIEEPNSVFANQQMHGQCIVHLVAGQTIFLSTSNNPNLTISVPGSTTDGVLASLRIRKIN
jgi:hypothetical protein